MTDCRREIHLPLVAKHFQNDVSLIKGLGQEKLGNYIFYASKGTKLVLSFFEWDDIFPIDNKLIDCLMDILSFFPGKKIMITNFQTRMYRSIKQVVFLCITYPHL